METTSELGSIVQLSIEFVATIQWLGYRTQIDRSGVRHCDPIVVEVLEFELISKWNECSSRLAQ